MVRMGGTVVTGQAKIIIRLPVDRQNQPNPPNGYELGQQVKPTAGCRR